MNATASGPLAALMAHNSTFIPGGVSSTNRVIDPPIAFVKGQGAYLWDIDGKHFRDYARPIDEYIRTHYRIDATFPGYEIWRRVEGQAPTYRYGLSRCRNLTRAS